MYLPYPSEFPLNSHRLRQGLISTATCDHTQDVYSLVCRIPPLSLFLLANYCFVTGPRGAWQTDECLQLWLKTNTPTVNHIGYQSSSGSCTHFQSTIYSDQHRPSSSLHACYTHYWYHSTGEIYPAWTAHLQSSRSVSYLESLVDVFVLLSLVIRKRAADWIERNCPPFLEAIRSLISRGRTWKREIKN